MINSWSRLSAAPSQGLSLSPGFPFLQQVQESQSGLGSNQENGKMDFIRVIPIRSCAPKEIDSSNISAWGRILQYGASAFQVD